jgi:ABC-type Fe3+ transport system permease subunit
MTMAAAGHSSTIALLTFVVGGWLLFTFGYARAVWVRARRDYRTTKAAVPTLRQAMWKSIGKAIQVGLVVVVLGIALIAWVARDGAQDNRNKPVREGVVSPSPSPHRGSRR